MKKKNLIILHGWQSKIGRWDDFKKRLSRYFNVYLPLLPGFGKEKLKRPIDLNGYCSWVNDYLIKNHISDPVIVGHSHGGRIAIKLSINNPAFEKLVLINSAGIKHKLNLKRVFGWFLAKTGKAFFILPPFSLLKKLFQWLLYTLLREKDYFHADKYLKETMANILKVDLTKQLQLIAIPTLICWGENDKVTPLSDAYILEKEIRLAKLVIWKDCGHSLPFEKSKEVTDLIIKFCQ